MELTLILIYLNQAEAINNGEIQQTLTVLGM
jgi:hypothetical protein